MANQLIIDLPPSVTLPPEIVSDQKELRNAVAVVLYRRGRISPAQAREMMGVTRREFEDRLSDYGFAPCDETDLAHEVEAARRLSAQPDA
jgi:predicted HTH domain antitoxin